MSSHKFKYSWEGTSVWDTTSSLGSFLHHQTMCPQGRSAHYCLQELAHGAPQEGRGRMGSNKRWAQG